jgi:hypothetical protein
LLKSTVVQPFSLGLYLQEHENLFQEPQKAHSRVATPCSIKTAGAFFTQEKIATPLTEARRKKQNF